MILNLLLFSSLLAYGNIFHLYLNGKKQTSVRRYKDDPFNMNSITLLYKYHKNDQLKVTSDTTCSSCEVTWTLWALGLAMKTHVTFMLGRTTNYGESPNGVDFDSVILDEGNGWDSKTLTYIVQVAGIYSLSINSGCLENTDTDLLLSVNGNLKTYAYCDNNNHADESVSANHHLMMPLNQGDALTLEAKKYVGPFGGYSDVTLQTSFSGFLYNPYHGCSIAWSVTRTRELVDSPLNPIDFDVILVNEGNAWKSSINKAECTKTGTYVVYINAEQNEAVPVGVSSHRNQEEAKIYLTLSKS